MVATFNEYLENLPNFRQPKEEAPSGEDEDQDEESEDEVAQPQFNLYEKLKAMYRRETLMMSPWCILHAEKGR